MGLSETTAEARKIIGQMVQQQRAELGLARSAVALHCGLNGAQVKALEEGASSYTIDTLLRVAHGMNCQIFIELRPKETDRNTIDWEKLTNPDAPAH